MCLGPVRSWWHRPHSSHQHQRRPSADRSHPMLARYNTCHCQSLSCRCHLRQYPMGTGPMRCWRPRCRCLHLTILNRIRLLASCRRAGTHLQAEPHRGTYPDCQGEGTHPIREGHPGRRLQRPTPYPSVASSVRKHRRQQRYRLVKEMCAEILTGLDHFRVSWAIPLDAIWFFLRQT